MRLHHAAVPAILILLSACGGGGGDDGGNNPPPPPPEEFTIGGTVSGLQGELVLQLNGANNLSISADGDFTFDESIVDGSDYDVTVLSAPRGLQCDVTNGSGTATADVSNVEIACSTDPTAFYTVFSASGATTADVGLYAVYSKDIGDDPAHVTDLDAQPVGYSLDLDVGASGVVRRGNPHALFFVTRDVPGGDHVWSVDLSGASALEPTQLTDTTFINSSDPAESLEGCAKNVFYEDLSDPDTAFLLLELPPAGANCSDSPGHEARKLIRLSDAATDAAVDLPSGIGSIQAMYAPDGTLSGFIALDDAGNFSFYEDETFTNPTVLRTDIMAFEILPDTVSPLVLESDLSVTPYSLLIKLQRGDGTNAIYRVTHTGAISGAIYAWTGPAQISYATDDLNLYVASTTATTNFAEQIVKIGLESGTSAQVLHSEGPVPAGNSPLYIIGVIGTHLILQRPIAVDPVTSEETSYLAALDLVAPAGPVEIFRTDDGIQARLRDDAIFLNTGTDTGVYSSAIIDTEGTEIQPLTAQSAFIGSGLQVRGIESSTGVGGGAIYEVGINSSGALTEQLIRTVDDTAYVLPDGTDLPYARAINSQIALGIAPSTGAGDDLALTFDLNQNIVAPHVVPGLDATYSAIFF
jgi:hypothetical protein